MYKMETALIDNINAQRKEAEEFSKQKEYKRQELVESAYYLTADRTSKSYARSLDFQNWTDERIQRHIDRMCEVEVA